MVSDAGFEGVEDDGQIITHNDSWVTDCDKIFVPATTFRNALLEKLYAMLKNILVLMKTDSDHVCTIINSTWKHNFHTTLL